MPPSEKTPSTPEDLLEAGWQPYGRRVLVHKDPPETETRGGLTLPSTAIQTVVFGTVVALSEELEAVDPRDPENNPWLLPGDRVMWPKASVYEIPGHPEYVCLELQDILLVQPAAESDVDLDADFDADVLAPGFSETLP